MSFISYEIPNANHSRNKHLLIHRNSSSTSWTKILSQRSSLYLRNSNISVLEPPFTSLHTPFNIFTHVLQCLCSQNSYVECHTLCGCIDGRVIRSLQLLAGGLSIQLHLPSSTIQPPPMHNDTKNRLHEQSYHSGQLPVTA